jgi:hypothetical protein
MAKADELPRTSRRARRSAAEWQAEVAGWLTSGLTAREYAKSQGVHARTLMGWASRLVKGAGRSGRDGTQKSEAAHFIPVRVVAPLPAGRTDDSPRFAAEVILTSGRRFGCRASLDSSNWVIYWMRWRPSAHVDAAV